MGQARCHLHSTDRDHSCTARFVRNPVRTKGYDCISGDTDNGAMHAPLGYNNRSDQRPRRRAHPGIDSRIQRTESRERREVGVGRKWGSIDLRDNDRDVTSFVVCVHDEVEYHLAIAEAVSHGLTVGVPGLLDTCGKETVGPNGEQGILMVGWSEVGV